MHKPLLLLPAVIFFALSAAPSPLTMPQESATPPAKTSKAGTEQAKESLVRAKKVYEVDCALCHGSNGNGKTDLAKDMALNLNDFTDPKTLQSMTDEQVFDIIRKGKDKMPGEDAGRAKNDEVKSLILYIRNFSKGQPSPPAESAPAATAATPPSAPSSN